MSLVEASESERISAIDEQHRLRVYESSFAQEIL